MKFGMENLFQKLNTQEKLLLFYCIKHLIFNKALHIPILFIILPSIGITLIYFLRKYHAKFISKIELTKNIPSISFNLKYGGGANIDRNDKKQSLGEIMKLGQRMKDNNWSTVIFPEGTRSKTGKMKEFQIGGIATILKKAPNALIVPIAIENSWKMVQYGLLWLNAFIPLKFTVLMPIEPAGIDILELVKEIEMTIKAVAEKNFS